MSGVVTVVLTDKEVDLLVQWGEIIDNEGPQFRNGEEYFNRDRAMLNKLTGYQASLSCKITPDGPVCRIPERDPQEP